MRLLRAVFLLLVQLIDPSRLVFIDESCSHIAMTGEYARAPRGERVHDCVPRIRGCVLTMLGAMDCRGLRTLMTIEGATTAEVFDAFVEHFLVPELKPGDVVVLDNVGAHKPVYIRQRIEAAGAFVLFLPPYSPDLNPIELCWSKFKRLLQHAEARTRDEFDAAIAEAMKAITPDDAMGWFRHCGFWAQPN
ncbi:IS630 family transposase [Archangium lansingense]|uniref:IS630 family transposase n=1 Tax=Archangium lansingense TaxID=2995310 RepID=A0ABT4A274_9BACT|nr:IS630 family transposase [Archangium lansinium]MCY1075713.1 IS630 family transposase [Archangium lansinium]